MNEFALIGAPNVGKTTVFNALTGETARTGNWQGVTVAGRKGIIRGLKDVIVDLPGIYSLLSTSPEEEYTEKYIEQNKKSLFICVVEAADFPRGIQLAKELIARGLKVMVLFTMYDEFKRGGGEMDVQAISGAMKIPVLAIDANEKKDINKLKELLQKVKFSSGGVALNDDRLIGLSGFKPAKREDKADRFLLNGFFAVCSFILATLAVFLATFAKNSPGDICNGLINELISVRLAGVVKALLIGFAPDWFIGFLADGLIKGAGNVLCFLPQLLIMYSAMYVMEESGYMARIAFMTDGIFKKVGLNGRAAFSLAMGFGCTAVALMSARSMENGKLKKKTVFSLPFISCSARLPVYLFICNAYFVKNEVLILLLIYFAGIILSLFTAWLLNRFVYNGEEEFLMELPPMRRVRPKKVIKALLFYSKQFIIKIGGTIVLVVVITWFLSEFSADFTYLAGKNIDRSLLAWIGKLISFIFIPMGINDWKIAVAAITGLFAKEAVAGTLAVLYPGGLNISAASALAFLMFCASYTPCFSALAAMRREVGLKLTAFYSAISFSIALLFGYLAYAASIIVAFEWVKTAVFVLISATVLIFLVKKWVKNGCNLNKNCCNGCKNEAICGKKRGKTCKIHNERV